MKKFPKIIFLHSIKLVSDAHSTVRFIKFLNTLNTSFFLEVEWSEKKIKIEIGYKCYIPLSPTQSNFFY